jgi:hypothetical protein
MRFSTSLVLITSMNALPQRRRGAGAGRGSCARGARGWLLAHAARILARYMHQGQTCSPCKTSMSLSAPNSPCLNPMSHPACRYNPFLALPHLAVFLVGRRTARVGSFCVCQKQRDLRNGRFSGGLMSSSEIFENRLLKSTFLRRNLGWCTKVSTSLSSSVDPQRFKI